MTTLKKYSYSLEELGFEEDEEGRIKIDGQEIEPPPLVFATTDVPDSRLVITHIKVLNFKSYAGEQTIGPFDKNFTAVVGPNGSGKSNVIDAMMFVFGSRANKIRAKKITSLIHKSAQYPNIESCQVTVNFTSIKEDGTHVKDTSFVVSRTVFLDGSSFYEMNEKKVTYKEISFLLRKYGIDMAYTRFLILQGEVESISLFKPIKEKETDESLLDYIEDIIGSNRFNEPIDHFMKKIKVLIEEINEKIKYKNLVENEVEKLKQPMEEALEYLRLDNRRMLCENSLYVCKRRQQEKNLENILKEKKEVTESTKNVKAKLDQLHSSRKALESQRSSVIKEYEKLFKECEEYKEEFKQLDKEDAINNTHLKNEKSKVQNLKKALEEAENELGKLTRQISIYESETAELQEKRKKLEEEKIIDEKKANENMSSVKQETEALKLKKEKVEAELIKVQEISNDLKSQVDLIQSELNLQLSGEANEKKKLDALESNLDKNKQSSEKEERLLQSEEEQIVQLQNELESSKAQLINFQTSEQSLSQQCREERLKLEEARSTQQSSTSGNKLVESLLKEKYAGRLPGVLGRLGQLGAIDKKYDIAISTACGRLDNIVTDNISTAQKCVDHLKKYNLGYTTFIALDQMKKYERLAQEKRTFPENVPRLLDLVRISNPKLLPVFYYALGDTLVANDLEQATRVGLQGRTRHRVVTLKGELIDLTGTMSGGGGRPMQGRMGEKVAEDAVSKEELDRMAASLESLNRKLSEVKQLRSQLEKEIAQKTSTLTSLHHSIKKRKMQCNAYREQLAVLTSQIQAQEKKVAETTCDKKKVKKLENEMKEKKKEYDKAMENTNEIEERNKQLGDEIYKISKGKLGKAKKTVEQLKKKLDDVVQSISKSTVNIKQCKTKIKRLENKIVTAKADLETCEKAKQSYLDKREMITIKGTELTDNITKYQNEILPQLKEKQAESKKEIEELSEQEHQLKRDEIEGKNSFKAIEAKESEVKAHIRHYTTKIGKLKLNVIDEESSEITPMTDEEIDRLDEDELASQLDLLEVRLNEKKTPTLDLSSVGEYKKQFAVLQQRLAAVKEVRKRIDLEDARKDELFRRRLDEFMAGLAIISRRLKEIYQMLTVGGDAEIEIVDRKNPFKNGIQIVVRPPKKSWKTMRNLSGGEKTLSSLALVFANHYYRPTPFYVMDEIDAALDFRNVAIVGYFLKERTKNAQFIIVSLRNVMNELSDHLLGIYKIKNCTHNITLNCKSWAADYTTVQQQQQNDQNGQLVNGRVAGH